jgi:hypothetical protein
MSGQLGLEVTFKSYEDSQIVSNFHEFYGEKVQQEK